MSDHEDYEDAARVQSIADARRAQGNNRAAELAAIRARAEREQYEYSEKWEPDGDGPPYLLSAYLKFGGSLALDLEEPAGAECIALRDLVQVQQDRRTLLARLDALEKHDMAVYAAYLDTIRDLRAQLDAALAERDQYLADFTAELDGGKEMRRVLGARDGETLWGCVERVAAERNAAHARLDEAEIGLRSALHEIAQLQQDRITLYADCNSAHALLSDIRTYLETRPTRTPMIERLVTAIVAETVPTANVARIDELP